MNVLKHIIMSIVVLVAILFFGAAVSNLDVGREQQALMQLEETLRRATVACYAVEGIYPPDLEYIKSVYGVIIDEERYQVHYEVHGSNLMPEITVLAKDQ